jgi:hypothetical protein
MSIFKSSLFIVFVAIVLIIPVVIIFRLNIDVWAGVYTRPVLMTVFSGIGAVFLVIMTLQNFDYEITEHLPLIAFMCSYILSVSIYSAIAAFIAIDC